MIDKPKICIDCEESTLNFTKSSGKRCRLCFNKRKSKICNENGNYKRKSRYRRKVKQFIQSLKGTHVCSDCKQFYPYYVMDFDHLNNKSFCIKDAYNESWNKILEEIKKCQLRCANCHRNKTQELKSSQRTEPKREFIKSNNMTTLYQNQDINLNYIENFSIKGKHCAKCKLYKSLDEFSWVNKRNNFKEICKICKRIESFVYRFINQEQMYVYKRNSLQKIMKFVRSLKDNKQCIDCKETFRYWQLDFDHKPEFKKFDTISQLKGSNYSEQYILNEISKCELRCANCHRIKTHVRQFQNIE